MPTNYLIFRSVCAVAFFFDCVYFMPFSRIWLGRGYEEPHWWNRDILRYFTLLLWTGLSICLFLDWHAWLMAFGLWAIFRFFYIERRWKSLLRGVGAVGFMPHWAILLIFALELAWRLDPSRTAFQSVLQAARIDLAVIFICAGFYKSQAGYLHGEGVEYALANPAWSWYAGLFRKLNFTLCFYRMVDISLCAMQFLAGILLLFPETQAYGAAISFAGFLVLSTLLRLGRLGFLMLATPVLFVHEIPIPDLDMIFRAPSNWNVSPLWAQGLILLSYLYLMMLPIVKVTQYANFFLDRSLPGPLQAWIERYANAVPIVIWRVFTADITSFFVRVWRVGAEGEEIPIVTEDTVYSPLHFENLALKFRFSHVGESVAMAALFNIPKYFASNNEIFNQRLIRYSKTFPRHPGDRIRFQFVRLVKTPQGVLYKPIQDWTVIPETGAITSHPWVEESVGVSQKNAHSPIRESRGYGSYVKKAQPQPTLLQTTQSGRS